MFKISDFARFSRVSAKMLRHYDDIGLLKPAYIAPFTDYRYYSAEQLPRLNRIVVLKELGFTLQQIASLLDDDLPVEQLKGMLKLRQAEVEQQLQAQQARLAEIAARLEQIESAGQPVLPYDVVLRRVEAIPVAAISAVVGEDDEISHLLHQLELYVTRHKARAASPPMVVYHSCEESEMEVEVVVPVTTLLPTCDSIYMSELSAVPTMACVVYAGNYSAVGQACEALCRWTETQNYQVVGPSREVYLRYGTNLPVKLPAEFLAPTLNDCVTELQFPVERTAV